MNHVATRPAAVETRIAAGRPQFPAELGGAAPAEAWARLLAHEPLAALERVRGSFAVAAALGDGRFLLAVDRFAVQSLCWSFEGGEFRFAERADALAGSAEPDPQALFDYLYFHVIPSPRTVFRGVHRLPAGHYAYFDGSRVTVAPYWKPAFRPATGRADFAALKREFIDLLQQSTADALDGGKAACFLSGGTDSSSVAGMIARVAGKDTHAYSIGFEAEGYDEMAYARIAAKAYGVVHHEYYVTPEDLVASIPAVAAHYDQPFGNSSALPAYYCAKMARDDGVTRILAGDGGDELFGGNSRYAMQRVFGWYRQVPSPLRAVMEPFFALGPVARTPLLKKGTGYIRQATVPLPDRLQSYNLLDRLGPGSVFTADFLRQVNPAGPIEQQREIWRAADAADDLDRNLAFDWRYTLAENDLPKVCGTTGLAGLEVGFPMLDERLVDFSMRLPVDYKLKGLKLRWFFKEALRGFLPDEIITKKKHGFGLPFGVWAVRHQGLNALAQDSLRSLAGRGVIRPDFVDSLLGSLTREHAGYYGEMVWILMMLEQWIRQRRPEYRFRG